MAAVSPSQLPLYNTADHWNCLGWTIGATNTTCYDGQYLAATEDVVVVTLNYRLGIFGYSGAPGLSQNVGLLDQRLVVEWVRDNIKGFGGSPSKIVIVGQSSGSVAVDYWSYTYV
jgi:cholinesterase